VKYALLLIALLTAGCAWHYPLTDHHTLKPEVIHPSADRIAQLAVNGKPEGSAKAFLRLSSPFVLAGNAVRLTCFVPPTADHRALRLALVDVRATTQQVNYQELLIASVPCGEWLTVCDDLGSFGKVLSHQEQKLESRGVCNQEDKDQ
jgi:hypothetical protein